MSSLTQRRNVRLQKWRDIILAILKSYRKAFVNSMLSVICSVSYFPCSGASSIPRSSTSKISVAYGGIGPPGFGRAP